ncbi:MAG: HAD family hydrolase [Verrucomicrobiales bacterium]|nr:HAD family hydrolase [Verrucomicrobiales bacterium]
MLAIFDIDGTICDTQEVEGRCFALAFEEVCGISLKTLDWTQYSEATSSGIARELLINQSDSVNKERCFQDRFVELLRKAQPGSPGDFCPLPGATEFIARLQGHPAITVAFATGGFDTEAAFKLDCCGIQLSNFPHATSSDTPRRRDIIPLAAERSGIHISRAVYFGDGNWDVEACRTLQIPMIGIGRRIDHLAVRDGYRDFSDPDSILETFERINNNNL